MKEKRVHRRFTKRDRKIVDHAVLYRMTTQEILHRSFFDENEPNAVTKVTMRLCAEDWLRKYPLVYPSQYLMPGRRAAQALGLPPTRTLPLGPQSLPTEYGALLYAMETHGAHRITFEQIQTLHPWYRDEWFAATHCLRICSEQKIVELLRIDLGGPPDHVARKCYSDIQARISLPEFELLVSKSFFRVVVVTATTEKAAAIHRALQGHLWPNGLQFHFAVIPQLLPLLPRCFDA